jgi:hypothetical protein
MNKNEARARLRAMLEEDTGSPEAVEALLPIVDRLHALNTPASRRDVLIDTLLAEMPSKQQRRLADWWPLLLLRAQMRVIRSEIWIASLLLIGLGTLVTLSEAAPDASGNSMPIVIVAPIVAAMGIAFIYGPDVDPSLEIQLATAIPPRLILVARLALVFGFDLLVGLASSVTLALSDSSVSLWPLILSWLAPMTFLSSLAFFLTIYSQEALLSGLICFVIWVWQAIDISYIRIPDLTTAAARPWLLVLAALLGGVALWLAGQEARWVGGEQHS